MKYYTKHIDSNIFFGVLYGKVLSGPYWIGIPPRIDLFAGSE